MRSILQVLRAVQKPLNIILDVTSVTLLTLLVLIISIEVFKRYVFNQPSKWGEEVAIAMLIWFGYLGITVGYRDDKHLAITVLYEKLPPFGRKLLDTFVDVVMVSFCAIMAWQGIKVARLDTINIMPATGIPMSYVSIVLTVSGCAMILEGAIKILARWVEGSQQAAPPQPMAATGKEARL